ncbi:hypothetical protein [Klebsiella aerogenes]|uniref:hypothetical protein n=1 Tax=Klebsiella aerogenes TaxID=548 RepID=UPI00063CF274|nr:hypothetical protein [Klebsiella aerogenes]KLE97052.1 hypothetical protein YA22_02995 [Klebsiella aerogenes]
MINTHNTLNTVNTMHTVNTLLNSFHENWHVPILERVNEAWRNRTPEALLQASKQAGQGIDALEQLERSIALLMRSQHSVITEDEVWKVIDEWTELACSLQYVAQELSELALEIAEEYGVA